MSVMSVQPTDNSNFLCKRFAAEASSMFEAPATAEALTARVPLENLFRVLEMFRARNFRDETRKGVLALETAAASETISFEDKAWYEQIETALADSIHSTFGSQCPEKEATIELQSALRWLATKRAIANQDEVVGRAKQFFSTLSASL